MFFLPQLHELEPDAVRFWLWVWGSSHAERVWEANQHGAAA